MSYQCALVLMYQEYSWISLDGKIGHFQLKACRVKGMFFFPHVMHMDVDLNFED